MPIEPDPLSGTRPLADPARLIALLMAAAAGLLVLLGAVLTIVGAALGAPAAATLAVLLAVLCPAAGLLGIALLALPAGKPNAIYLRAFRTDRATARLRAELAAILGPVFRLSGIRTPRKKIPLFVRFLVPGLAALYYAGSKYMELEAGDDWMARLWKTYQQTRLVFIDSRDLTAHVHLEIQLTLEAMGAERCIFVVDARRPEDEWRQAIAAIAGPEGHGTRLRLLHGDPESVRSGQTAAELKGLLSTLPEGVPGAIDRGRQFVLEHVTKEQLEKSRRRSRTVALSALAGLALGAGLSLLPHSRQAIELPIAILGLAAIAGAILRASARIKRLARVGHRAAALRSSFMLAISILPFFASLAILLTIAIPAFLAGRQRADEAAAVTSLRTIYEAELMYETADPARGFACPLSRLGGNPQAGGPTPVAAQSIDETLASGMKAGYTFKASDCTKATLQGLQMGAGFQLTATPSRGGGKGWPGFCMDETGVIRVDRRGGTRCTELLQ